ncbi:MAG: ATP-binding protein [Pseudopelagicola sp.]|nr:ATP-binding protein [Pseudopelagicola sp.]
MFENEPTLHMVCGKIAAGKSTLCTALAQAPAHVYLSEDAWLSGLYGEEMTSLQDYVRCAARLRAMMGPHVVALLRDGLSVVLDFQANTKESRAWLRGILDESGAAHVLHVLDVEDAVCLARLRARNASGAHDFAATEAQFRMISNHFVPPAPEEGFTIQRHGA